MNPESNKIYKISDDVVAREIEEEVVIVPIVSGIGSMDDDLYTLNSTGRIVWKQIDGEKNVHDIARVIGEEYDAPVEEICSDILDLFSDLLDKGILIEA